MIKLVIFDAYGVILDGGYPQTCQLLGKKFDYDWKELYAVFYTKYFNMAAEKKITQKEAWDKAIEELGLPIERTELLKLHYGLMSLNKRVAELAQSLDVNTLLLSKNTREQFADAERLIGFQKYFKNVINTWELGLQKASEETCNYLFDKFNVKPEEIIYIDDQEQNLAVPKKLGVKTILYEDFDQFKSEFDRFMKQ